MIKIRKFNESINEWTKKPIFKIEIEVDAEKFMGAKAYSVINEHIGKPIVDEIKRLTKT